MFKHKLIFILVSICIMGCATTVKKSSLNNQSLPIPKEATQKIVFNVIGVPVCTDSADWEIFKGVWRASMKSACNSIGSELIIQDGDPNATYTTGTLVVVKIKDYRYLSKGARIALGAFIGNAYVDSVVGFFDLKTGIRIDVKSYKTCSSAFQGIFAPMTEEQVQAICNEIVYDIYHL